MIAKQLSKNVLGFLVDSKLNMSMQCVVKEAKNLLGCFTKDITRRVRQIKLLTAQYW